MQQLLATMGGSSRRVYLLTLLALIAAVNASFPSIQDPSLSALRKPESGLKTKHVSAFPTQTSSAVLLELRGGVQRAKKKTPEEIAEEEEEGQGPKENTMLTMYKKILPVTRVYLTVIVALSIISMTGIIDPALFALDPVAIIKGLQLWRLVTSACFLGPPSMGMVGNLFLLYQYGSSLETQFGSAQKLVFLIFQAVVLSFIGILVGFPYVASALVSAALWVCARQNPHEEMQWQFGLTIPKYLLPFGLMAVDVLQAQSPMAAVPHILGILTGHFYYFVTSLLPLMGGTNWLQAPDFMRKLMEPGFVPEPKESKKSKKAQRDSDDEEDEESEEEESEEEESEEEENEPPPPPKKKKSSSSSSSSSSKKKSSSSSKSSKSSPKKK
mmetsp:Transcript_17292/g.26111  ORF Transcript_17292/g.26111 Transcript_17292/m.26111 type:complete len:384 (-) Transcript_17292:295-1446(-)